ncbi:MAG: type I DNA topoisomerase [Candidatus Pacebacteria bacterium]|nr:type I DNA topoisomerase [Candidatus Paceibacterota bacterium]
MSKLVIVESPAKAKTIEKYLSEIGNYRVVASVGHIRDLPKNQKKAIDIEKKFKPNYEVVKGKEKIISDIKSLAKKADEVLLATDPDREGEAIAWHLKEAIGLKGSKRIVFNEITKEAIQEAINHPREIDMHLKEAQEARRVLDRLFGYGLSGLIWKKVRYGLSAGRVQSPALRILMEREREIRAFNAETFWVITADVKSKGTDSFIVTCVEEPRDKNEVLRILNEGEKGKWIVKDIKETKAKRSPQPPFITSTLQQAASTRLGYSPSRTMQLAQKLYEAGHITYMRTDSTNLSAQAIGQIKSTVEKRFGADYFSARVYGKKSKGAQEAHEAIRPTNFSKDNSGQTEEQKRLYNLIWARTVSSQMIDAQLLRTRITANIEKDSIPDFTINGQRTIASGWMKADPIAKSEETEVPKVKIGESLDLIAIKDEEKQTQPPSRYTEAGLIKELEKRGIGRPSTYAAIIRTLNERGYVNKEGRTLIPTDTGDVVSSFVEQHFDKYISDDFTAEMESELDEIAEGKRTYEKTMKEFYDPFMKDVDAKDKIDKLTNLGDADPKFKCPKCKSKMQIKLGKAGKFLSCEKFPDCDGALTIEGEEWKVDAPIGTDPESGLPITVLNGRFGPYLQIGEKTKENPKPRRASIPKEVEPSTVTMEQALKFLSLPRNLGNHPVSGKEILANNGRFGPYVMHDGDFRSLKTDNVYEVDLKRALEILAEEKKTRRGRQK